MLKTQNEAIKLVKKHLKPLLASLDIAGVTLGGSFAKQINIDSASDIDIYVYINNLTLPNSLDIAKKMSIDENLIQERTNLLEYRLSTKECEIDIKIFTFKYIKSNLNTFASLDPQYLEELNSYAERLILYDFSNIKDFHKKVNLHISKNISLLLDNVIERYTKELSWCIFQWTNRKYETVAIHSLTVAFNNLLCAFYLTEGVYPPSVKWRASKQYLFSLNKGKEVFYLMEEWMKIINIENIDKSLSIFFKLENLISNDFTLDSWKKYKKRKWWLSYKINFSI